MTSSVALNFNMWTAFDHITLLKKYTYFIIFWLKSVTFFKTSARFLKTPKLGNSTSTTNVKKLN